MIPPPKPPRAHLSLKHVYYQYKTTNNHKRQESEQWKTNQKSTLQADFRPASLSSPKAGGKCKILISKLLR